MVVGIVIDDAAIVRVASAAVAHAESLDDTRIVRGPNKVIGIGDRSGNHTLCGKGRRAAFPPPRHRPRAGSIEIKRSRDREAQVLLGSGLVEVQRTATKLELPCGSGDVRRATRRGEMAVVSRGVGEVAVEWIMGQQSCLAFNGAKSQKEGKNDGKSMIFQDGFYGRVFESQAGSCRAAPAAKHHETTHAQQEQ